MGSGITLGWVAAICGIDSVCKMVKSREDNSRIWTFHLLTRGQVYSHWLHAQRIAHGISYSSIGKTISCWLTSSLSMSRHPSRSWAMYFISYIFSTFPIFLYSPNIHKSINLCFDWATEPPLPSGVDHSKGSPPFKWRRYPHVGNKWVLIDCTLLSICTPSPTLLSGVTLSLAPSPWRPSMVLWVFKRLCNYL